MFRVQRISRCMGRISKNPWNTKINYRRFTESVDPTSGDEKGKKNIKSKEYFEAKLKQKQILVKPPRIPESARKATKEEQDYAKKLAEKFPEIANLEKQLEEQKEFSNKAMEQRTWWSRIKYQLRYGDTTKILAILFCAAYFAGYAINTRKDVVKLLEERNLKRDDYERQIEELQHDISIISGSSTSTSS